MLAYPSSLHKTPLFMNYVTEIKKNFESLINKIPISQIQTFKKV